MADAHGSVVVLRKHHNKLRKTVYKEMLRGINRLEIPKNKFYITRSPMEITYNRHGTTMYFAGSDGIDDTKGIIDEDKPIKLVIVDELTEFFDDGEGEEELANIEATFVRGNSSGFQMIYLYNPPKNPNAPINQWCKKMEQRDDCIHIHTDYRDVPSEWLGQDLIDTALEMEKNDPKMYRWVWLGESTGVDDLIYYMFCDAHRREPVVSSEDTGVSVTNYQFDRYCTLLDGLVKMLKSKGYRLQLSFRREQNEPGYLLVEAVPIVDYSDRIEFSRDCKLNYTMDDKQDGVNHLIVTGKGELQDRNILHLYVQADGSISKTQHYTGLQEIAEVYENTSTETEELEEQAREKLLGLMNKKTFKMDVAALGVDVNIGDIVGGRDYLTGMYMAKPVENIVYEIINDVESKTYKLEGEGES